MRAINSHLLKAKRDNKNNWKISKQDLDAWCAHTVRQQQPAHAGESANANGILSEKLAVETARADAAERARDQAETDRDRWREIAEKLVDRPRFIWPWKRGKG